LPGAVLEVNNSHRQTAVNNGSVGPWLETLHENNLTPAEITATEFNCNLFSEVHIVSTERKSSRFLSAESRAGKSLLENFSIYPVS